MKHFLRRAAAYIIDCIICYTLIMLVLQWAILSNVRTLIGITDDWFRDSIHMELYVLLTISLPVWIYFIYFDSNRSKGSFGKRIMRLSVYDEYGERISLWSSFKRTFLKLLPWETAHLGIIFPVPMYIVENPDLRILTIIGILLFIVYALCIIVHPKGRSIYDKMIGTVVLEENQSVSSEAAFVPDNKINS